MKKLFFLPVVLLGLSSIVTPLSAQLDSNFAYCNLFYLTSDHNDLLPFNNKCFLNDNYNIINIHKMRLIGPIHDQDDIFRDYDFSFTFYLPDVSPDARLVAEKPADFSNLDKMPAPGKCYFTVSDNRQRREYGPGSDGLDYVTVSGKVKITEYRPASVEVDHPEFNAQLDVYLQQVDRSGPSPVLKGPLIRVKGVLAVERKANWETDRE